MLSLVTPLVIPITNFALNVANAVVGSEGTVLKLITATTNLRGVVQGLLGLLGPVVDLLSALL